MKTIRNIFPQIYSFENLYRAFQKARRGKRYREYAVDFEKRLEENLLLLSEELRNGTYSPGTYRAFWIKEPKPRLISAAPFRDRVVHHALIDVINPLIDPSFIEDSYACRLGKGTHKAIDRCQQFLRRFDWVLKCDIRKYFPSIDHKILMELLKRHIYDEKALKLIGVILDTSNPQEPVLEWFLGDNLLTPAEHRIGIPIGNLTSQFFANLYLDGFDHFIKHELGCKGYLRYMDDFIIFDKSKDDLLAIREKVRNYLATLRLKLHNRKQEIFPAKNGLPFLGFHIYRNNRRLSSENIKRFNLRINKQIKELHSGRLTHIDFKQSFISWIGHAQHGNTWRLRERLFDRIII